jgi:hypothetical protein
MTHMMTNKRGIIMTLQKAYRYWYQTARIVFRTHEQRLGFDLALENLRSFRFHASGKYQVRKEQGDPTWQYEYARFSAYRSLHTRLTSGAV